MIPHSMQQGEFRVGLGHDTHRLVAGRKLVLGGVAVDFDRGPVGHSDADVVLHALIDALLGAAGLGDIGEWFPNTDERWAGADSSEFLAAVSDRLRTEHWRIVNADCTIFAEQPKLTPHKPHIRRRLAELLGISVESVNVKAKSGEQVGPVGRGEAIAADAIVLLQRTG
jgi:2-C-methyl-D-erythritol 2,4-cyclodiphosphate synthase